MSKSIDQYDDLIDIRDVIERYEELRDEEARDADDDAEMAKLKALLDEAQGCGGDEQWEGEWYPVTLIRESYFQTYAQELADDLGCTNRDAQWPYTCIDWEQAANELRMDYTSVEFEDVTYYCR